VQRPRKRLKFENVLTVVPLLFLARTIIASLTDDSTSKAAKIVVRHKIVSVTSRKGRRIRFPAVTNSRKPKGHSALLQIVAWYSLSSFVKSPYTCLYKFAYKLKIVTGLS